ncbi:UNVERIFIED_CONTAM: GntR family transcriptional regulator [Mumia flava]
MRDRVTQAGAQSRAERLAALLEERMRDADWPAGTPLGTLESLREESGLSRPTVSEAVRLLRDRGLVVIKPGRGGGLFVAEGTPVVRLRHTLLTVAEEPSAVLEAIELRDHLESLIDVAAARHRDADDVADLRRLVDAMGAATDWPSFMTANWSIHRRIAEICPNAMARAVYVGTLGHLSDASSQYADGADAEAYRARRHQVHADLVDAIASGDEDRVLDAVAHHHRSD